MENIDFERLRKDLLDYFGTAMYNVSMVAMGDYAKVKRASEEELIEIAIDNKFDLNDYKVWC